MRINRRMSYREQRERRAARRDAVVLGVLAILLALSCIAPLLAMAWNM